MEYHRLEDGFAVAPQIAPEDIAALSRDGVRVLICNRPDTEVPPDLQTAAMRQAAASAGLTFIDNPVGADGIGPETLARQTTALTAGDGPVLAYCRTGTRSALVWAMARAGDLGTDAVLAATAAAGYDFSMYRPQIETMAPD